ncbi:urease accessory protein ureF [Calderihabitans maritimus]|uniref:Urease accessory protein ureF n=2 Tax=Calderihabitans maritimus TaxID=1246530 RepID=A0A1Z5HTX1_9FIRM|nr:urease accessory protein ureF [Calderihabitans maritimus]
MLGYTDCLAACLAYKYASDDNFDSIVKLDQIITALKASREVREASLRIGKMMLKTVEQLFGCPLIERYSTVVNKGIAQGHHAVIFGLVARSIGLSPIQTNIVFLYNAAASMVNAAIKLIPLGQREGQGVLFSLHPTIMETAHKVLSLEERNLGAFAPALEIRCMAHERLYTRLFMS